MQAGHTKHSFKPKPKKTIDTMSYAAAATRKKKMACITAHQGPICASTSRMAQEDHDNAMDTAIKCMTAHDMTIDIQ
jgi:hypothetical protein